MGAHLARRILLRRAREQAIVSMWAPMYKELFPDLENIVENGLPL